MVIQTTLNTVPFCLPVTMCTIFFLEIIFLSLCDGYPSLSMMLNFALIGVRYPHINMLVIALSSRCYLGFAVALIVCVLVLCRKR